jgi:hypothetical protein
MLRFVSVWFKRGGSLHCYCACECTPHKKLCCQTHVSMQSIRSAHITHSVIACCQPRDVIVFMYIVSSTARNCFFFRTAMRDNLHLRCCELHPHSISKIGAQILVAKWCLLYESTRAIQPHSDTYPYTISVIIFHNIKIKYTLILHELIS